MDTGERYRAAAHRVQTAIAFQPGSPALQPKHMRVGIDMSKADAAGLARLLIEKGIFTLEEYQEALAESAEAEADAQEAYLSELFKADVKTL